MKDRIKYAFILGALRLIALLPLPVLYLLSDGLFPVVYYLLRYRRRVVRDNLSRSFPEKQEKELRSIERKFYHHLCDCIVETIKLLHLTDCELDRRVEVTNGKLIDRLAGDGRPIVLYLGHYGNWEWVQAISRHYKRPAVSGQIYRPLHDAVMGKVMERIRARFEHISIPQKQAFRTLLRMKQEGKQWMIGFIADQRPNSSNLNHWTRFLNQETAYSAGGDEIGMRTEAHFVYLDVEKVRRGHYRMTFLLISPDCEACQHPYALRFMALLEATIRRAPQYWLWSHKRWRFPRPEGIPLTEFKHKTI